MPAPAGPPGCTYLFFHRGSELAVLQEVSAFMALLQRICNWFRSGVRKLKKTLQGFSYISLTVVKEAMDLLSISCHGYLFFLKPQVLQPSNYLRNLVLALKEIIIAAVDKGTEILILTGKTRKLKTETTTKKQQGQIHGCEGGRMTAEWATSWVARPRTRSSDEEQPRCQFMRQGPTPDPVV